MKKTIFLYLSCLLLGSVYLCGCATARPKGEALQTAEIDLKSFCAKNHVAWQWDSVGQVFTLKVNGEVIKLLVDSDVVIKGDETVLLSSPVRFNKAVIMIPKDFETKVFAAPQGVTAVKRDVSYPRFLTEVVVDAGHGGKDPGAIGKSGTYEKKIVLDIALKLKRLLESKGIKVLMTRSTDEFISLQERTEITSRAKADMFVSIHANSNPSGSRSGVEVYALKDLDRLERNEEQRIANQKELFGRLLMKKDDFMLETIVSDMLYTAKQSESDDLARIVSQHVCVLTSAKNWGVKKARYFVLRNTLIPAVLVEVGYLTNPKEEGLLNQDLYRQKIALGIAKGILHYGRSQ